MPSPRRSLVALVGLAAVATIAVATCSGNDTAAPASSAVDTNPAAPAADTTAAPSTASAPTETSAAVPDPTIDTSSTSTAPAPSTSAVAPIAGPLTAAILDADDVGVPAGWVVRDADPAFMDQYLLAEADPFHALVACADDALRPGEEWLQRTYLAPDQPLDDGLLRVDLIVANVAADTSDRHAAFETCSAEGSEVSVTVTDIDVTPRGGQSPVRGTALIVTAGPSADVPYPSAYVAVSAVAGGRDVTAVMGGLDQGVGWTNQVQELAEQMLAQG